MAAALGLSVVAAAGVAKRSGTSPRVLDGVRNASAHWTGAATSVPLRTVSSGHPLLCVPRWRAEVGRLIFVVQTRRDLWRLCTLTFSVDDFHLISPTVLSRRAVQHHGCDRRQLCSCGFRGEWVYQICDALDGSVRFSRHRPVLLQWPRFVFAQCERLLSMFCHHS